LADRWLQLLGHNPGCARAGATLPPPSHQAHASCSSNPLCPLYLCLQGSPAEDIILTCCLAPCLLCQLAREAQDRTGFTVPLADKLASKAPAGQEASRDAAPVRPCT
jgi:hypothetical protein